MIRWCLAGSFLMHGLVILGLAFIQPKLTLDHEERIFQVVDSPSLTVLVQSKKRVGKDPSPHWFRREKQISQRIDAPSLPLNWQESSRTAPADSVGENLAVGASPPVAKTDQVETATIQSGTPYPEVASEHPGEKPAHDLPSKLTDANPNVLRVDLPPRKLFSPKPDYPLQARLHNWEGSVTLSAEVTKDGRVNHTQVLRSSGYIILDNAAKKCLERWRFQPALSNNQPVACLIKVTMDFELKKEE